MQNQFRSQICSGTIPKTIGSLHGSEQPDDRSVPVNFERQIACFRIESEEIGNAGLNAYGHPEADQVKGRERPIGLYLHYISAIATTAASGQGIGQGSKYLVSSEMPVVPKACVGHLGPTGMAGLTWEARNLASSQTLISIPSRSHLPRCPRQPSLLSPQRRLHLRTREIRSHRYTPESPA